MATTEDRTSTSPPAHLPPGGELGAPENAPHGGKRSRIGILKPLKHRDFAFLWAGMTISLLSIDWLISTLFVPVSFVLTGPISKAVGVKETMVWAGILACAGTFLFLLVPGIRDTEKDGRMA